MDLDLDFLQQTSIPPPFIPEFDDNHSFKGSSSSALYASKYIPYYSRPIFNKGLAGGTTALSTRIALSPGSRQRLSLDHVLRM
jgi:hypothetical protein